MPPAKLTVTLSAVTPLFMGGAEPNQRAEVRLSSFKGLLRYWYRALDGHYQANEGRFFGSSSEGQSPCLLRVTNWEEGTASWADDRYRRPLGQGGFQRGAGTHAQNGIVYLGYSLNLRPNERKAIEPRRGITLQVQPRPGQADEPALHRAWLAAFWLLVHVGGVGSRARRGLGSLRLERWEGWPECAELPLPSQATTPAEWEAHLAAGLERLRAWFLVQPPTDSHTALGPGARFLLVEQGHRDWEAALDDAGLRLQQFRQRREPDYRRVKAHVTAGAPLQEAPERVGFGLPLEFRFSGTPGSIRFQGTEHDRMASPLFVRVVRLGSQYHAAFMHLPTPLLPRRERVRGGRSAPLELRAARTVIERFLDEQVPLVAANGQRQAREVRW